MRPSISLFCRSSEFADQTSYEWRRGNNAYAVTSSVAPDRTAVAFGRERASRARDGTQLPAGLLRIGLGEDRAAQRLSNVCQSAGDVR